MSNNPIEKRRDRPIYVLGQSAFAAISAVEGLRLTDESKMRLERNAGMPQKKRREETIQAFSNAPERL